MYFVKLCGSCTTHISFVMVSVYVLVNPLKKYLKGDDVGTHMFLIKWCSWRYLITDVSYTVCNMVFVDIVQL